MKRTLLALLPMALVAACGTPQEQCIRRNTGELRTVEKLITEAQGNLERGYAYDEQTRYETVLRPCTRMVLRGDPPRAEPVSGTCRGRESYTVRVPRSIDLAQESVKLQQLREKRTELTRRAQSVISQCKAMYPEAEKS